MVGPGWRWADRGNMGSSYLWGGAGRDLCHYRCQHLVMEGKKEASTGQAKETAPSKVWSLETTRPFRKHCLFPVINYPSPNNDLQSICTVLGADGKEVNRG